MPNSTPLQVPSVLDAVTLHETTIGQLTRESTYRVDPVRMYPHLMALRERDFSTAFPSMEAIFSNVTHNNGMMLKEAITTFIPYPFNSLDSFHYYCTCMCVLCTSSLALSASFVYLHSPTPCYPLNFVFTSTVQHILATCVHQHPLDHVLIYASTLQLMFHSLL